MKKVFSVVNWIKSRSTDERLFKQLCVDTEECHIRLLFAHSRTMISKGTVWNGLLIYKAILEFVGGREEFQFQKLSESKVLISYLADICGKLNA